jgi:hypothetical protein
MKNYLRTNWRSALGCLVAGMIVAALIPWPWVLLALPVAAIVLAVLFPERRG